MNFLLTANFSTQFLKRALEASNEALGSLNWKEADFGSVIQSLLSINEKSSIDSIIILIDGKKLEQDFYALELEDRINFGRNQADILQQATEHAISSGVKQALIANIAPTGNALHGTNTPLNDHAFESHRLQWNQCIGNFVLQNPALTLIDLERLVVMEGIHRAFDSKLSLLADQPWSLPFTETVASFIHSVLRVKHGSIQKCLILDLDNTIWGGVIGDDGLEGIAIGKDGIGKAFRNMQLWAKELKRRGIILCVCSKNTESVAREPFSMHPDMVLREEDIAVFVANWENKAANIQYIQEVLNIGFDSMVFLDDNPAERSIVRENIPDIIVPELPENPEDYLDFIQGQHLFETSAKSVVTDSKDRNKQYQIEAKRMASKKKAISLDAFLSGLEMRSQVSEFVPQDFSRIEELFQRSNQFNLTTYRYTTSEIAELTKSQNHITWSFRLEDKFGHHGLISLVVGRIEDQQLTIEAWVMSCRVLNRTMEEFIFNCILKKAQSIGLSKIQGLYIPTEKNILVENLYSKLGFVASEKSFFCTTHLMNPKLTYVDLS